MKRLVFLIILFSLIITTGCQTALERDKKEMLEIYCNDENYISLTGKVITINSNEHDTMVVIKCESLKQHILDEDDECEYWVFSNSNLNITVGDMITYITVKVRIKNNEWLPIVAINKNGEDILAFNEGKSNLINWVNQLQMK